MPYIKVEYIWIDGYQPTAFLRSKTKIVDHPIQSAEHVPQWSFDGSSTRQAEGRLSDCLLQAVRVIPDPVRGEPHMLALCEVLNPDGTPHSSNTRFHLRELAEKYSVQDPWFGIEQEYTLYKNFRPLGFPDGGFPFPQGKYYCGVGTDEVFGRSVIEAHLDACLSAGIKIAGINAEVMPGQWEFQVGPLGPLEVSDALWLSRWLLYRVGENFGVYAKLDPKPIIGDWNGAGAHTNFSTKAMRESGGINVIVEACKKLGAKHFEHMKVYGADNELRLTGLHETCSINDFRYGVSDRGASIRIPVQTAKDGYGYLEDRRPAANMDPYTVCAKLIETVCGE
ncbi:MAG: glutamine synthetase GlnII [Patescibacteria group bacterium]